MERTVEKYTDASDSMETIAEHAAIAPTLSREPSNSKNTAAAINRELPSAKAVLSVTAVPLLSNLMPTAKNV